MVNDRDLATEYAGRLDRFRSQWDVDCPGVDAALAQFAAGHSATVRAWVGDAPSRLVTWQDEEANYSISMLLEANHQDALHIWPMAWRDYEEQLKRYVL